MSLNFADVTSQSRYARLSNTPSNLTTWCAADFYRHWKSIASAGFEPASLGSSDKGTSHYTTVATSVLLKTLIFARPVKTCLAFYRTQRLIAVPARTTIGLCQMVYSQLPSGSNPADGMDVCLLCFCVVLSCVGKGLCDGPITRPEESYRVSVCD
jgi:hypothetical protein